MPIEPTFSDTSSNLDLPFIQPAQAQKHVTHNEAVRILDVLVQLSALTRAQDAPPANPQFGERHIVGSSPFDEWTGHPGEIAVFEQGAWSFLVPTPGTRAWVEADQTLIVFDGAEWLTLGGEPDLQNVAQVGINATADATNRLTVAAPATLLNNDGGSHRLKINRATPVDTASVLFQSGFAGRAEMGISGSDDFTVKVSADGSTFVDGMTIEKTTGVARLPEGLKIGSTGAVMRSYEEGDWTPLLGTVASGDFAGSTGITVQSATYLKIGAHVTVTVAMTVDGAATAAFAQNSVLELTGLPFAPRSMSTALDHPGVSGIVTDGAASAQFTALGGHVAGGDAMVLRVSPTGTGDASPADTIHASGSYLTDS